MATISPRENRGSFISAFVAEPCFDCNCCALNQSPDECMCGVSTTARATGCGPLWTGCWPPRPAAGRRAGKPAPEHAIEIVGDFRRPSSANDPIFLFTANVDRNYENGFVSTYTAKEMASLRWCRTEYPTAGLVRDSLFDILESIMHHLATFW